MRTRFKITQITRRTQPIYSPIGEPLGEQELVTVYFGVVQGAVENDGSGLWPQPKICQSGQFGLANLTAAAAAPFVQGAEYFIDFDAVPAADPPTE